MLKEQYSQSDIFMLISVFCFELLFLNTYVNLFAFSVIYDVLQVFCSGFFLLGIMLMPSKSRDDILLCILMLLFFILILYFAFYRTSPFITQYNLLFHSVLPILYGLYFFNCESKVKHWVLIMTVVFLSVGIVTTINGLNIYSMGAKNQATPKVDHTPYYSLNIFGYQQMHMLLFALPLFKSMTRKKFLNLLLLVGSFIAICLSQYTIAILLSVLILVYVFSTAKINNTAVTGLCIFTIIVLFLFLKGFLGNWLINLSSGFSSDYSVLSERLAAVGDFLLGNTDESLEVRFQLYTKSLGTFIRSPIFGSLLSNEANIGGHSAVFDLMGRTGLLGLSLGIGIIIFYMKRTYYLVSERQYKLRFSACLIVSFVLACVNTYYSFPAMSFGTFFLPVLCYKTQNSTEDIIEKEQLT